MFSHHGSRKAARLATSMLGADFIAPRLDGYTDSSKPSPIAADSN